MILKPSVILFLFFLNCFFQSNAQSKSDSLTVITIDSTASDTISKKWSKAEKAAFMSACFPGLGQFYNKKYWKMPIIWAGEAVLLNSIFYNHYQYNKARNILSTNDWIANPSVLDEIGGKRISSESNYKTVRDIHRRNRDYYIILASILYGLNIVDAVVDAHLSEFDLSDNLSLEINPNIYSINNTFATELTFNFRLK